MDVPESPEALFELLSEPSLRQVFPRYDELVPRNQKLIRLLHTEMTKGELTDRTFTEFVGFVAVLWRSFNSSALQHKLDQFEQVDEVDDEWLGELDHLSRTDQFLQGLINYLNSLPGLEESEGDQSCDGRYRLNRPAD